MKKVLCLCLFVMFADICGAQLIRIAPPTDTVFAKGGTCMYKIYKEWEACMNAQQERLNRDSEKLSRYVTREEQQKSLDRIACCAYWEFLSCVERAADEKCTKERIDMKEYARQLGPARTLDVCTDWPRDSYECSGAQTIEISSLLFIILLIICLI